jgi:predicted Fe-Mo cluster-binding NifX family protein
VISIEANPAHRSLPRKNASRWAVALRDAGADVVLTERAGSHGGAFWREEFPLMVAWAFGN